MYFQHSTNIWHDYPELVAGVLFIDGITNDVSVESRLAPFITRATTRLDGKTEGELPEIQAWRRVFARMGLKPTQYRCASESLLRRFRKENALPRIHPLIDLCNAASLASAIPVAVFDVSRIADYLEVRYAAGDESYETFSGEIETPLAGEVIFADGKGRAHARRWSNRQSGLSAISNSTASALIVAEAMHAKASSEIPQLIATLADELDAVWSIEPKTSILSESSPRFAF